MGEIVFMAVTDKGCETVAKVDTAPAHTVSLEELGFAVRNAAGELEPGSGPGTFRGFYFARHRAQAAADGLNR